MKIEFRLFAARSKVAVANKAPVVTLSSEERRRLFLEGPMHGYPLVNRLGLSEKEVHYMLDQIPALILELKRLGPALERDPGLAAFRKSFLDASTDAKNAQTNLYAIPFEDKN